VLDRSQGRPMISESSSSRKFGLFSAFSPTLCLEVRTPVCRPPHLGPLRNTVVMD
jgi:hypothetical protein